MDMDQIEILAPGGSPEHVRAAVEEEAHAVYVGPRMMSGRSGYAEMDMEDVRISREITREAGVKLYAAINRSIPPGKEKEWKKLLQEIADIKPDALIVGSFCVYNLIREMGIDLPLHASTFIGIYNPSAVRFVRSLGFSRIILNTSIYIDEIESIICNIPDMEYELIAYGGICYNDNHRCNLPHGIRVGRREGRNEKRERGEKIQHPESNISSLKSGDGSNYLTPNSRIPPPVSRLYSRESTYCQLRLMLTDKEGNTLKRGRLMCYPVIELSPVLPLFIRMGIRNFKIAGRERSVDFVRQAIRSLKKGIEYAREQEGSDVENYAYIKSDAGSRKSEAVSR